MGPDFGIKMGFGERIYKPIPKIIKRIFIDCRAHYVAIFADILTVERRRIQPNNTSEFYDYENEGYQESENVLKVSMNHTICS